MAYNVLPLVAVRVFFAIFLYNNHIVYMSTRHIKMVHIMYTVINHIL